MADKTTSWHGAVNGSWIVAGNWTNGQPSTGTDNDTVIFLAGAINPPSIALDRTADAATGTGPQLVYIEQGANYPIGSQGNPLVLECAKVVHRGGGTLYYRSLATDEMVINSPNAILAADIDADGVSGQVNFLQVTSGHVVCSNRLRVVNLTMTSVRGLAEPTVLVVEDVAALSQVVVNGGRLDCRAAVLGYAIVAGGVARFVDTAGNFFPLLQVTGGIATYKATIAGLGITILNAVGGTTNLIATRGIPLVITNYSRFPNARVFKDDDNEIVSITNEYFFE